MGGAVAVGALEPQHDLAGAVAFEAFVGNGRAGDAAAQAFEFLALTGASRKTNYLANVRLGHFSTCRIRSTRLTASRAKAAILPIVNLSLSVRSGLSYHN